MRFRILHCVTVFVILTAESLCVHAEPAFTDSFGESEKQAMGDLMREIDKGAARAFLKRQGAEQAVLLSRFWDRHCPTFSLLYVDFHLGHRNLNASPHFYNDSAFLTPDYWVHKPPRDENDLNRSMDLLEALLKANPEDGAALVALGYVQLEVGELEAAESSLRAALKSFRNEPCVYNGLGLSWVKRRNSQTRARDFFRDALALNRQYEAASYNLAMSQIATNATDVPFHIGKVTRTFPDHHDVYYKLGVWHEIRSRFDGEFLDAAAKAYRKQTEVNASHHASWANLARVTMALGGYRDAIGMCKRVLDEAPAYRVRVLPVLMEAYQMVGQIAQADRAADQYVSLLDSPTAALFRDVRLVSSSKEAAILKTLSENRKAAFVHDFWIRHDPTPGTPENEMRVEHVRRVGVAMNLFSEAVKPWDTRGEVYIRYGDPKHKSRSDNMRFETDADVVRVRNRLLDSLSDDEKREIQQYHRRIRTSTRDAERTSFSPTTGSDFEPAEFGTDAGVDDPRVGRQPTDDHTYQPGTIESINDRVPPADIRGLPLYPVEGNRPWEYWVYPDVDGGIEIVFAAPHLNGGYGFAEPPQSGRRLSRFNKLVFEDRRPEEVVRRAIEEVPSRLNVDVRPMSIAFATADFKGEGDQSRLEVYVGRTDSARSEPVISDVSLILYDRSWNRIAESSHRFTHNPVIGANRMAMETQLMAPPGGYILAVQVDDPKTGEMGAERMGIEIDAFPEPDLAVSDIVLASEAREDTTAARGGLLLVPHPWGRYATSSPVVIYYEIYGLQKDAFGQTRYEISYQITPLEAGTFSARVVRSVGRQFGLDQRGQLKVSYERTGESTDENSYLEIDVSGSASGRYELTVTVRDVVSGKQVSKFKTLTIEDGELPID